eukprot:scaffold133327_cov64-Phaeocystis_antarctica.AAC.4
MQPSTPIGTEPDSGVTLHSHTGPDSWMRLSAASTGTEPDSQIVGAFLHAGAEPDRRVPPLPGWSRRQRYHH